MGDSLIRALIYTLMFPALLFAQTQATVTISGTTNTEDTFIRSGSAPTPDYNYGANVGLAINTNNKALIRVLNLSSIIPAGATITAASLNLYCSVNTTGGNTKIARILKPWVEGDENGTDNDDGDATWNDWASDANEWGTAGCANASDAGTDNSGDGTGYDCWSTGESTVNVNAANAWFSWTLSTALVQGWYSGTYNSNGVVMSTASANNQFRSSEYTADATKIPYFSITYTLPKQGQVIQVTEE